jgi:phospholipase C
MLAMKRVWLAFAVAAIGCGGTDEGPRSSLTAEAAAQQRQACAFKAGTPPGLSQAKDAPLGSEIPIDTIVVVMMENRSFDHLLQALPAAGQGDVSVAPAGTTNDDTDGTPVPIFHLSTLCFDDTNHGWSDVHGEWDGGKMDGFVKFNKQNNGVPADGRRAMGYYTDADLPWLYAAASTFALADHNFSSVLGPTFPNREYLYAATSFGHIGNDLFPDAMPTIMQSLTDGKVDWRVYYETQPGPGIFIGTLVMYLQQVALTSQFFADAAAGTLGQVNFVDANLKDNAWWSRDDFHPPGDVQLGEKFMHDVVDAMMRSPQWPHAAVFLTFDEHGGSFDHVPPPRACAPDAIAPITNPGDNANGDFATYGVRVPLIVVSPYAKPHFVSHAVYDHTSILRFIESRFRLPALTARDANADPFSDMFDFKKAAFATPPSLPAATVDPQKQADCVALYPEDGGSAPVDGGATD